MKLISIGFGSTVCAERVLAVIAPESAPIKRLIQEARERGMLIDASFGRKTKSVLLMDTDHVLLSSVSPEILSARNGWIRFPPCLTGSMPRATGRRRSGSRRRPCARR